eukprot:COSAG01_NODE_34272_length_550_cov_1.261641_1_plen_36_part_10
MQSSGAAGGGESRGPTPTDTKTPRPTDNSPEMKPRR